MNRRLNEPGLILKKKTTIFTKPTLPHLKRKQQTVMKNIVISSIILEGVILKKQLAENANSVTEKLQYANMMVPVVIKSVCSCMFNR